MLTSGQWVVIYFIILEFSLVILFIALVYVIKLRSYCRGRVIKRLQSHLIEMLNTYAQNSDLEPFKQVRQVGLLLFTAREYGNLSEQQLVNLVKEIILPKQIDNIGARDWKRRYRLMTCFEHYIDPSYYDALIRLIADKIPIIRINSCIIASSLDNDAVFQAILNQLFKEDRTSRVLYIENFKANKNFELFLYKQLKKANDDGLKRIIYDIFVITGCSEVIFELARQDSLTGTENKRLAAIRCLPKTNHPDVILALKPLLEDELWLVRNAAVQSLENIQSEESISLIGHMLKDSNWWVKTSAAKILARSGEKGLALLEKLKSDVPSEIADFASYFLEVADTRRGKHG